MARKAYLTPLQGSWVYYFPQLVSQAAAVNSRPPFCFLPSFKNILMENLLCLDTKLVSDDTVVKQDRFGFI